MYLGLGLPIVGGAMSNGAFNIFQAGMTSLPSNITFTRASSATDFNNPALNFGTNVPVLTPSGLLLQGARTNLLLNSATLSTQNVTTTNVAHTLSFYGTGTVTLSGTSTAGPLVGTGANNRVTLTFTPTAGTLTLTVTGTVTQAQLELGFASSYIPTTGATATRAADVATISNLASIGFNALQGSLVAEFTLIGRGDNTFPRIIAFTDGTVNNQVTITNSRATGFVAGTVRTAGVIVADISASTDAVNIVSKAAFGLQNNNVNFSYNGGIGTIDTSVTLPTVDRLQIGWDISAQSMFGYLRRLTYFPTRLSDSQLQALTA